MSRPAATIRTPRSASSWTISGSRSSRNCASSTATTVTPSPSCSRISALRCSGMASSRDPSWEATRWRLYRSSRAGLNTCTRCRAICARRTRRMSSSLFPLNMLPQMTSMRPRPLVLSTRVPPLRKKEEGETALPLFPFPSSFFAFRLDFEPVLLGELLNATFGIDELPLPREEWMAMGTDLDADVLLRGPGHKGGAAGATDDGGLVVLGMDAFLHGDDTSNCGNQGTREQGNEDAIHLSN